MRYRIEYVNRRACDIVGSRKDLLERLQTLERGTVEDIRKLYKSGVSDSVLDTYNTLDDNQTRNVQFKNLL